MSEQSKIHKSLKMNNNRCEFLIKNQAVNQW